MNISNKAKNRLEKELTLNRCFDFHICPECGGNLKDHVDDNHHAGYYCIQCSFDYRFQWWLEQRDATRRFFKSKWKYVLNPLTVYGFIMLIIFLISKC